MNKNFKAYLIYILIILSCLLLSIPMLRYLVMEKLEIMKVHSHFSVYQLTLLSMINPLILSLVGLTLGHFLHQKTKLKSVIYQKGKFKKPLMISVLSGVFIGFILVIGEWISNVFIQNKNLLETSFIELLGGVSYGGVLEEIIIRFGLMTLISYSLIKITKRESKSVYIISILISSLIFSLGHLPAMLLVSNSDITISIIKVMTLNMIASTIYGFLYYKYYLECAMVAHIMTHVTSQSILFLITLLF